MTIPTGAELLVVFTPDGLRTICTDSQAMRIMTAWTSLLRWLRGADPDDLPESDLVAHVVNQAALRTPRFPAFDIRRWADHAWSLEHLPDHNHADGGFVAEVAIQLLTSILLKRRHQQLAWLNRVAIELLYSDATTFQQHRHILIPRLLDGPVSIQRWTGQRCELAQAAKFLIRRVLSQRAVSNLVHMEITTARNATNILKAVEIPDLPAPIPR